MFRSFNAWAVFFRTAGERSSDSGRTIIGWPGRSNTRCEPLPRPGAEAEFLLPEVLLQLPGRQRRHRARHDREHRRPATADDRVDVLADVDHRLVHVRSDAPVERGLLRGERRLVELRLEPLLLDVEPLVREHPCWPARIRPAPSGRTTSGSSAKRCGPHFKPCRIRLRGQPQVRVGVGQTFLALVGGAPGGEVHAPEVGDVPGCLLDDLEAQTEAFGLVVVLLMEEQRGEAGADQRGQERAAAPPRVRGNVFAAASQCRRCTPPG